MVMASIDDAGSALNAADEICPNPCEPCKFDGRENEGKKYCVKCKEFICEKCTDLHKQSEDGKDHDVINAKEATSVADDQDKSLSMRLYNTLLDIDSVSSVRGVDVSPAIDEYTPHITGCVFMSDGKVVLCDNINRNVKLLSSSLEVINHLELSERRSPWGISVVDNNNVIVSSTGSNELQYIQVEPCFKPGNVIKVDTNCNGVKVVENEIYITTCYDYYCDQLGEVTVFDMEGNSKRKIKISAEPGTYYTFQRPLYIAVSSSGRIYISDWDTSSLTCLQPDGSLVYQYMHKELKAATGVYVDDEDNVLLCGAKSHCVHLIDKKGEHQGLLLAEENGLRNPWSVAYRQSDKTVIVGCFMDDLVECKIT